MLAGSHRNAWPDETGTGGRTNRNTQMMSFGKKGTLYPLAVHLGGWCKKMATS